MAAAPWFCVFSCWVSLLFAEIDLFSAKLPWWTSPLFEYGLPTVTGALMLDCSDSASLSADWLVSFELLAVWLCSTSWPELSPLFPCLPSQPQGSEPLLVPEAEPA